MDTKKFFLHSCGISLLTNYIKNNKINLNAYKYSNLAEGEMDENIKKRFEKIFSSLEEEILNNKSNFQTLREMSAELNALFKYTNNLIDTGKNDVHFLLFTDTYLGKKIAEIVEKLLRSHGFSVYTQTYKDLRTKDFEEFLMSLSELIKDLSQNIEGYSKSGYRIIFNLTGGFKSINSFLQTMASLYADESIYIFETGTDILKIPRLPIKIDDEIFRENINLFRKLELEIANSIEDEIKNIPEILYVKVSEGYNLSVWGEMLWQKVKKELYMEKLVEPISEKIIYTPEFKKSVNGLSAQELYQLNKTLDKLELYLSTNSEKHLSSLRFKPIKGKVKEHYTHEIYPFDGNDSRRLYIKKEDDKLKLIRIDKHLK